MLVVGQNSWVTVPEADTYMKSKIRVEEWFTLSGPPTEPGAISKESLLTNAFNKLMSSAEVELSASLTDSNIKKAQIEYAWYLYKYGEEIEEREMMIYSGVSSFKFSNKSENLKSEITLPKCIFSLLSAYSVLNTTVVLKGEYDA